MNSSVICADSFIHTITVLQNAIADFIVKPICINLPLQLINTTLDTLNSPVIYLWNLGNGQSSILRNPPVQVYPLEGVYPISLSVSTALCPQPNTIKHYVIVEKPKPPVNYPVKFAVVNLPLSLSARQFGESVLWIPGHNLDAPTSYTPVFVGSADQVYIIEIKTRSGCITPDTQLVKTVKRIEIYVPNAFTPNSDGINDYLRPVSFGIKQVKYFRVFNRWDQLLFEMHTDMPGWDGTFKGVNLETQTVVWFFKGTGVDGNEYTKSGTSILIR